MAVLLFVLFWVILAVALVLTGLMAGRKRRGGPPRRGGRALWYGGFVVVLAIFGAGIPIAASLGNESSSKQVPAEDISNLTSSQQHGRLLFAKYCKLCHTLKAANAVASVGPN